MKLRDAPVPEVRRVSLASVVLRLKAMGVRKVHEFAFLEPPSNAAIARALERLVDLTALDAKCVATLAYRITLSHIATATHSHGGSTWVVVACTATHSTGELTKIGKEMAAFPLSPVFAYMLLRARDFGCTHEIVTLVALLSADNLFYTPREHREQAARARRK